MTHSGRFALSKFPLRSLLAGSMLIVLLAVLAPAASATHARPKGATPLRASLVPANNACVAPNRSHGPPLAFPSCAPPVQSSSTLTVGTPDAPGNGATAGLIGSVLFSALPGPPGAPDDSDVGVVVGITDVRCLSGAMCIGPLNSPGARDYYGELQVQVTLLSTDHYNDTTGSPTGTDPATSANNYISGDPVDLRVPVICDPAVSPNPPATGAGIGATCTQNTTIDAVYPSAPPTAVKEGARSNWELGQVRVLDGGADGVASTTPNQLFLIQGIFIP